MISENFIVQMIPHHHAAIAMSHNLLRFTTNLPLQDIATEIISEQTQGIDDMRKIMDACSRTTNCQQDICLCQRTTNQIMQTMFSQMDHSPCNNDININFINEMIPHHRGAIEISKTTLQYDISPDLIPILESIITSQEQGIYDMQKLLRCMN